MGVDIQHHASAALLRGNTRYPLYRRLGVPQVRSGLVRKISPPPGFDPRTVQSVASRNTDCAIPFPTAQEEFSEMFKLKKSNVIKKYFAFRKTQLQIRTWNDCKSQFFTEITVPFPLHDIPLSSLLPSSVPPYLLSSHTFSAGFLVSYYLCVSTSITPLFYVFVFYFKKC